MSEWTEPKEQTNARVKRYEDISFYWGVIYEKGKKHYDFLDTVKKFRGNTFAQLEMLIDRFVAIEIAEAYIEGIRKGARTLEQRYSHFEEEKAWRDEQGTIDSIRADFYPA